MRSHPRFLHLTGNRQFGAAIQLKTLKPSDFSVFVTGNTPEELWQNALTRIIKDRLKS